MSTEADVTARRTALSNATVLVRACCAPESTFEWYTWSDWFRGVMRRLAEDVDSIGDPPLVKVPALHDYDATFSLSPARLSSAELQRDIYAAAGSLSSMSIPGGLVLLHGLLGEHFGTREIRTLFALFRGALVELTNDPHAALSAPLGKTGPLRPRVRASRRPLQARAFDQRLRQRASRRLRRERVSAVSELPKILSTVRGLRAEHRKRILAVFDSDSPRDRFDELYDLLHGPSHSCTREIELALTARQLCIKLGRGQGYLIHDRRWLHGREAPTGGVPENRLHRLAFRSSRPRATEELR